MSSGPFGLPANAVSVDWVVLNNSSEAQTIRVTVYELTFDGPKTVLAPGQLVISCAPGAQTHNANSVGTIFHIGANYEVVVETNDRRVLPNVQIWQDLGNTEIPGTLIPAGDFVNIR